ncbi:cytochrome c oxidase-assembly factor COX23 mitochondrial [Dacryopinax primogenitus]|uniref:Cytochrome c oxidase-assembly factor COX23 mitochondrial n=1 Tax=Dacryopinax primogenitus (strain DJM 731) TaxID=1858805 RepID=M5FZS9_DACPD|nr:cytochrome c oxidase-assembly factor COX23 mitochondrial [Dacryopinax primogenitus]EJU03526.1 cytochrome c oxidase-assembly factor COX23 mitochondrial [Dacryopinax primogenitus]
MATKYIPPEPTNSGPEPAPTGQQPTNYKQVFEGRVVTKFVDPCEQAAKESMACLNRHSYDRDQCLDFFQAYRDCKQEWLKQRRVDRANRQ